MFISNNLRSNADFSITTNKASEKRPDTQSNLLRNIEAIKKTPELLIGKTIEPHVASKISNKVSFDGHGKILSFKKNLSSKEYEKLASSIIPDLAHTPARSETAIRTPQECLVKIATIINKSNLPDPTKQRILSQIKDTFLAGKVKPSTISTLYNSFKYDISGKSRLMKELIDTVYSLEKEFYTTKHNDNYYGRTFDTELAKYIVNSPSAETINNTEIIKNTIINSVKKMTSADKVKLCDDIRLRLRDDPATWGADIKAVKDFIKTNDTTNLFRMLNIFSSTKHLMIMQLAVKFMLETPDFREIATISNRRYNNVIIPQRQNQKTLNPDLIKSSRTGIQLHYQVRTPETKEPAGVRPIDKYRLASGGHTEHNRLAMAAEHPVVVGMSGSANVLNYFFGILEEENPGFDMDHARLFAAAYLTHSGGHSFNEAYTVFNYEDTQSFEPVTYDSIRKQNDYARTAIDAAYDKLLATAMEL